MPSVNKAILVGNLTRDPEVKYLPSGKAVCNISIATSESWKDKATGQKQEQTEFHRVVFYDKLAEIVGEFCKKGAPIYVMGSIHYRKYQDKQTGVEKYVTEIKGTEMQLLGSRGERAEPAPAQQPHPSSGYKPDGFEDTDLPF